MNNNRNLHLHLSLTEEEAEAFKAYCKDNGIIAAQLVRRLLMKEISDKSTLLSADYVPPKVLECLKANKR